MVLTGPALMHGELLMSVCLSLNPSSMFPLDSFSITLFTFTEYHACDISSPVEMLLPQPRLTELTLHLENSNSLLETEPIQPGLCEIFLPQHVLILSLFLKKCSFYLF